MTALGVMVIFVMGSLVFSFRFTETEWLRWVARGVVLVWAVWSQRRVLTADPPR